MKHFLMILILTVSSLAARAQDSVNQPLRDRLAGLAGQTLRTQVSVREITAPPAIDGRIGPGEWRDCSAFAGFQAFPGLQPASEDLTVLTGYDRENFYFLLIVPLKPGELWESPERKRDDSQIFRDNLVMEWFFYGENDQKLRRVAMNSAGSLADSLDGDAAWNGNWRIAVGKAAAGEELRKWLVLPENFCFVEGALPLRDLQLNFVAGQEFRFNLFLCGIRSLTFAPIANSVLDKANFAVMKVVSEKEPAVAVYRLGDLRHGSIDFAGRIFNGVRPEFDALGIEPGTQLKVVTGYDEVAGYMENLKSVLPVTGDGTFNKTFQNSRIRQLDLRIRDTSGDLFRLVAPVEVESGLKLQADNYPSLKKIRFTVEYPQFKQKTPLALAVKTADGTEVYTASPVLDGTSLEHEWNYSGRPDGRYIVECRTGGSPEKSCRGEFEIENNPEWLNNRIGSSGRVLIPFEPLQQLKNGVKMWNREYTWNSESILFDYRSGGEQALARPATLNIRAGDKSLVVPLGDFKITAAAGQRMEFEAAGKAGEFSAVVNGWVEYDGLCWYNLKIKSSGNGQADAMYLEFPLRRSAAQYMTATPARNLDGAIRDGRSVFPWQVYFWVGSPDGGLGFISESMRGWHTGRTMPAFELNADAEMTVWRIHLAGGKINLKNYDVQFGLQVTPVKALPADYHSLTTNNWDKNPKSIYNLLGRNNDFTTIWYQNNCRYMKYFCDPAGVDYPLLKDAVENAQSKGIPAIPYFAPISFTEDIRPEHVRYRAEWIQEPLRHWKIKDDIQARACLNSSFQDWTVWQMRRVIRETGANGLYFDGAWPVECSNTAHGCGWADGKGRIRPTYAVLAAREFLKRIAVMLEEETAGFKNLKVKTTVEGKPYPAYYFWLHNSTSFGPPVQSFGTDFFSGESMKAQLRQGKTYRELLTVDNFRPRYLSQPWGVPVYLLAICSPKHSIKEQTESILAYQLPQGVPLYARYLDQDITLKIVNTMAAFGTRNCEFIPSWRSCGEFRTEGAVPELQIGVWRRADGALLIAAGNCSQQPLSATLQFTQPRAVKLHYPEESEIPARADHRLEVPPNSLILLSVR